MLFLSSIFWQIKLSAREDMNLLILLVELDSCKCQHNLYFSLTLLHASLKHRTSDTEGPTYNIFCLPRWSVINSHNKIIFVSFFISYPSPTPPPVFLYSNPWISVQIYFFPLEQNNNSFTKLPISCSWLMMVYYVGLCYQSIASQRKYIWCLLHYLLGAK